MIIMASLYFKTPSTTFINSNVIITSLAKFTVNLEENFFEMTI